MGRSLLPARIVMCCPLSADMPEAGVDARLRRAATPDASVTWVAAVRWLPLVVEHVALGDGPSGVALDIPAEALVSLAALRDLLTRALAVAPGLDAAVCRGSLSGGHRRVLVEHGIRVACRRRFDDAARGSRRPAPVGWPCRSELWGLWEVLMSAAEPPGVMGRFVPWAVAQGPGTGGLSVVDLGGTDGTADVEGRRARWQGWMRRQGPGWAVPATLSALPGLIAGAARNPVGGSVLRAA